MLCRDAILVKCRYGIQNTNSLTGFTYQERERYDVVGHMPQELTKMAYYFTSKHDGVIQATVIDAKFNRSSRADGLVIKCR